MSHYPTYLIITYLYYLCFKRTRSESDRRCYRDAKRQTDTDDMNINCSQKCQIVRVFQ